jgi:hypothetical protein
VTPAKKAPARKKAASPVKKAVAKRPSLLGPDRKPAPGNVARKPTVTIENVSPTKAKQWLQGNVDNRKLREGRVLFFSRLLQEDEWELTGDAIVFDDQGVLINGQHRLTALVVAKTSAQFLVLRGVPSKAQEVMDQGLSRNLGDQLHRRGTLYPAVVASALQWLAQMNYTEKTGNVHYSTGAQRPSLRELLALFEANPELADEQKNLNKIRYYLKVRPGPTLALYHRLLQIDREEAEIFFKQLQEGTGLAKNDPIWRLREWCIAETRTRNTKGRAPAYRYVAMVLKAWNFWRDGKEIQKLTWQYSSLNKEAWPVPY